MMSLLKSHVIVLGLTVWAGAGVAANSGGNPPAASVAVMMVAGKTGALGFVARCKAIRQLGTKLNAYDIALLYEFLDIKAGGNDVSPEELNALKNDVANALKKQEIRPEEFARRLMVMFRDPAHDAVWRDYCVQHLGDMFDMIENEEVRLAVYTLFWEATREKNGTIPGTALIALYNRSGRSNFDQARLAGVALAMVSDGYGEPATITALQICAKLGEIKALPVARQWAVSDSAMVRVSAIACIGSLGEGQDLVLLEKYASGTDVRMKMAARAAIRKLKDREGNDDQK